MQRIFLDHRDRGKRSAKLPIVTFTATQETPWPKNLEPYQTIPRPPKECFLEVFGYINPTKKHGTFGGPGMGLFQVWDVDRCANNENDESVDPWSKGRVFAVDWHQPTGARSLFFRFPRTLRIATWLLPAFKKWRWRIALVERLGRKALFFFLFRFGCCLGSNRKVLGAVGYWFPLGLRRWEWLDQS